MHGDSCRRWQAWRATATYGSGRTLMLLGVGSAALTAGPTITASLAEGSNTSSADPPRAAGDHIQYYGKNSKQGIRLRFGLHHGDCSKQIGIAPEIAPEQRIKGVGTIHFAYKPGAKISFKPSRGMKYCRAIATTSDGKQVFKLDLRKPYIPKEPVDSPLAPGQISVSVKKK